MSWYKITKKNAKSTNSIDNEITDINNIDKKVSDFREEDSIYFAAYRKHETSYYVYLVNRQIDNDTDGLYWVASASAYSIESGNVVYRKNEFFKKKSDSRKAYTEMRKRLKKLQYEFGASTTPTSTLSSMIWYILHDIVGDSDLSPKAENNIVYLTQKHNINDNKGNLLNNIIYLKNADYRFFDKSPGVNEKYQYF